MCEKLPPLGCLIQKVLHSLLFNIDHKHGTWTCGEIDWPSHDKHTWTTYWILTATVCIIIPAIYCHCIVKLPTMHHFSERGDKWSLKDQSSQEKLLHPSSTRSPRQLWRNGTSKGMRIVAWAFGSAGIYCTFLRLAGGVGVGEWRWILMVECWRPTPDPSHPNLPIHTFKNLSFILPSSFPA